LFWQLCVNQGIVEEDHSHIPFIWMIKVF
jgi:hypothetical protein